MSLKNSHLIGIYTRGHQILIGHLSLVDHSLLVALFTVAMETICDPTTTDYHQCVCSDKS